MTNSYAVFVQGAQPPTARPIAIETRPHAVGFGMTVTLTAAKKKNSAAIPKKILPMVSPLNLQPYTPSARKGYAE